MSLPAHHFHGSVTVILSKTAQKPVDKKRPLQLQMEKSEEMQKKKGLFEEAAAFFSLKYPPHLGKSVRRLCRGGVKEGTSVTIRICSVYVA